MARSEKPEPTADDILLLLDKLARAQHRVALYDGEIHRLSGSELTAPQARVLFCLGGTDGLTCSDITERTLITKGTLTGVVDRLEEKGLVQRWSDSDDGRRIIVDLTRMGKRVYRREYPRYVKAMTARLSGLSASECTRAGKLLDRIAGVFE